MAIQDITKPIALDETLQATNGKMDSVITKLQGIIDALGLDPSVYKPAGSKTCAELLPALLIASNLGNVYNITDSGTTTSDFVEGSGKPIPEGSNVAIVDVGTGGSHVYKFDLLAGMIDLSNYVQKSSTAGLIKNDGSIDTKDYAEKVDSATTGNLAGLNASGNPTDSGISGNMTTTSASGNPISISNLKSAQIAIDPVITFEPIQAGSGDPSPSNVRAISGYDKIEVLSCGKNLFDKSKALSGKAINNTGAIVDLEYFYLSDFIPVKPNATYYLTNGVGSSNYYTSAIFTKNKEFISELNAAGGTPTSGTMPIPSNAYYIRLNVPNAYIDSCQLEEGSVATTYEPHHKTTDLSLQIGQTIYGATYYPRTGALVVDRKIDDLANYTWTYQQQGSIYRANRFPDNARPSYDYGGNAGIIAEQYKDGSWGDIYDDGKVGYICMYHVEDNDNRFVVSSPSSTVAGKFVYKLAQPFTIQLTPHEIALSQGYNYISTNGTSISLAYHNGELATHADVEQLAGTVNELGDSFNTPYICNNNSWCIILGKIVHFGFRENVTFSNSGAVTVLEDIPKPSLEVYANYLPIFIITASNGYTSYGCQVSIIKNGDKYNLEGIIFDSNGLISGSATVNLFGLTYIME